MIELLVERIGTDFWSFSLRHDGDRGDRDDDDDDKEGVLGKGAFKMMIDEDIFDEMRRVIITINTLIIICIRIILIVMIMFIPLIIIIITCLLAGSVSENKTPSAPRAGLID